MSCVSTVGTWHGKGASTGNCLISNSTCKTAGLSGSADAPAEYRNLAGLGARRWQYFELGVCLEQRKALGGIYETLDPVRRPRESDGLSNADMGVAVKASVGNSATRRAGQRHVLRVEWPVVALHVECHQMAHEGGTHYRDGLWKTSSAFTFDDQEADRSVPASQTNGKACLKQASRRLVGVSSPKQWLH